MRRFIKKYLFVLTILFAVTEISYAQNRKADSLFALLKTSQHDTSRFATLLTLGRIIAKIDPDTALYFQTQAKLLADKLNSDLKRGQSLNQIGRVYYITGNNEKAISNYNEAIKFADKVMNAPADARELKAAKRLKSTACGNLGNVYSLQGDYSAALNRLSVTLKLDEDLGEKQFLAMTLSDLGVVYSELGDNASAIQYYFRALKISEETANLKTQINCLMNIGLIHFKDKNFNPALDFFNKALKICEDNDEFYLKGDILGNIASVYFDQKRLELANEYFYRALQIHNETGNHTGQAQIYSNIGLTYLSSADSAIRNNNKLLAFSIYRKALESFNKALNLNMDLGRKPGLIANYCNIAQVYIETKKYDLAEKNIFSAEKLARETNAIPFLRDVHMLYSDLYEVTSRNKKAFHHYQLYIQYRDSISNEENTKKSVKAQMQYEFDKKESQQRAEQEKKDAISAEALKSQKTQRNYFIIGFVLLFLLAAFIFRSFLEKRKANRLLEEKNLLIQKQKHLVEEKQKEVLDSIYYARRIQQALITNEKYIIKHLERLNKN